MIRDLKYSLKSDDRSDSVAKYYLFEAGWNLDVAKALYKADITKPKGL